MYIRGVCIRMNKMSDAICDADAYDLANNGPTSFPPPQAMMCAELSATSTHI